MMIGGALGGRTSFGKTLWNSKLRGFDPADLFASGATGVVLAPASTDMLFQDAPGQVPVLGGGDPVGLLLDASQGVGVKSLKQSLGPDLVVNGRFEFGNNSWSIIQGVDFSVVDGVAELRFKDSRYGNIYQSIPTKPGRAYLIELPVLSVVEGTNRITLEDQVFGNGSNRFELETGLNRCVLVAGQNETNLNIKIESGDAGVLRIEEIRVCEIQPLSKRIIGLGPELITNGSFTGGNLTGWTGNNATLSAVDGGLEVHALSAYGYASQSLSAAGFQTFLLVFDVLSGDPNDAVVNVYDSKTASVASLTPIRFSEGDRHCVIFQSDGLNRISLRVEAAGNRVVFDNISLREIPGHHAVQPVNDDFRPTQARDARGVNYLQLDGIDDFLTATLPDLGSDVSEWWADEAGVVISTGQTIGAGARNLPDVSKLYCYGLLNRALTAFETAQLTTYLNHKRGA